jgi:hypothetical protein
MSSGQMTRSIACLPKDHLGSLDVLTDEGGNLLQKLSFVRVCDTSETAATKSLTRYLTQLMAYVDRRTKGSISPRCLQHWLTSLGEVEAGGS